MIYEGTVYRPPSEAYSLIIQVTVGCSHNGCTFCSMYKNKQFKIRSIEDILADLEEASHYYKKVKRIFLADGDAFILKTEDLKLILNKIKELFPNCERVGIYATPGDILRKSDKELKYLKEIGLGIVYMGIESGSDEILKEINKGYTSDDMIKAGKKIIRSGIKLSATLISGLGGKEKSHIHAVESARVISEINPDYLGLLTLMVEPGTEMYDRVKNNEIQLLTPKEVMRETKRFITNLKVENCVFRSNHASNYASLSAVLDKEKGKIIDYIDEMLKDDYDYKNEVFRSL